MSLLGGIELAPLKTSIKVDIKSFKSEMDKVKSEAVTKAKEVSKQMESTIKMGDKMSKLGSTLTKTLTVPIVGAGTAITKMAMDYESSFAKVSTLLDSNVVDFDKYKNDILDASSESKVAVGEFSEAVYGSISAGVDQKKAIKFTTDAMKLAKGGFTDGAKAVDVMTTAINGYSLSADDATEISDMLITTQNLGKTTVDELAASMGKVIPVASSVNFGMDELSASYAQLTKNGIATAEAGTYLKAMLSELGKSGSITDEALRELTGKGFAELKKEGKSTSEILNLLDDYAKKNGKSIKDMFGSVEAGSAALVLGRKEGKEYNEMLEAMQGSAGATQEAFDKMDATPSEKLKGALNELKNSGIKLGANLIPVVTKIADKINDLVEWFNKLSPAQQENILKIGAMVAVAGPLLKITGNLTKSYGKLKPLVKGANELFKKGIPVLGKLGTKMATHSGTIGKVGASLAKLAPAASAAGGATGLGGLAASLGSAAVAAAPVVAGIAAIAATGYVLHKNLSKEVIPKVDLFRDHVSLAYDTVTGKSQITTVKISEETQKQVQAYIDLSNSAQQESMNMYAGVTEITDKNVASITDKVNNMSDSIIAASKAQRDSVIKDYESVLTEASGITAEQKEKILAEVRDECDARIKETEKARDRLIQIYTEIKDSGGTITENQQQEIDELYTQMKENAIEAMSQSKAEQETILHNLNNSNERITAEMVGNTIKQMNEIRDKSVSAAQEEHDRVVAIAMRMKESKSKEAQEAADAIIKAADDELDASIKAAEQIRTEGIDKLMYAHQDMADKISINTGEVLTWWERLTGNYEGWDPKPKNIEVNFKVKGYETMQSLANLVNNGYRLNGSHYNGLSSVPFDGYNARLHEGERVLTKKENEAYTKALSGFSSDKIVIEVPVKVNDRELAHATAEAYMEEFGFRMG